VSRVATQFPNALGRSDVPTELAALLDYYGNLEAVRLALKQSLEIIEETSQGVAADGMALADRYVQSLQISRNNDAALDGSMEEIDAYNKRFANGQVQATPPPPEK
jgi:hypothetical protein